MKKILVVLAHPLLEKSKVHANLVKAAFSRSEIEVLDLYENYPDFNIDIKLEQKRLATADVIIFQHPVYWYSVPPILKQYIDMVFEYGWAYGPDGHELDNKYVISVVSTGGTEDTYTPSGKHGHSLNEFFLPIKKTVELCRMFYFPPFVIYGSHRISEDELIRIILNYKKLLEMLMSDKIDYQDVKSATYINSLIE